MRPRVFSLLVVGCASADPGYGPSSPTRPDAPVTETSAIATALEDDPAPEPEGSDESDPHAHHRGHGMAPSGATMESPRGSETPGDEEHVDE